MACISQDFGSLAPFCCLPRYIRMSRESMAAVPMVRNCMTHTASEGFTRPKEKANSEDEWEVDDDSEDGSGSDSSGEEPGEEVAAEDSQASNSDASEQVDSEAS